jgi:outer membrane murein-binding lipoprotein Lpp
MTLTRFLPVAFLAAAIAAPAAGQTADDIKKLNDKLDALTKSVQELKDGLKTDNVREKVTTVDSKIDQLDTDIQSIQKDLRDLKRKVDGGSTTALRPQYDSSSFRGQGRVRFINEFPEEVSVVLNGRAFRLLPGQERLVPVPPGDFTYQVLNVHRAPQLREIAADETKNIRIFPLQ